MDILNRDLPVDLGSKKSAIDRVDVDLDYLKKQSAKTAKQLCYPDSVVDKIQKAETINGVYRVMKDARNGIY